MSKIKPLARKRDIVVQEFGSEILIYDLKANKVFNLNETSTLIWQASTGEKNIAEIADDISKKLNSPINEEFVWLALEQLRKQNLIENKTEIEVLYQGISRREIIKRVGLASLVALPLVSSLVAPTAVNAASCTTGTSSRGLGCPCTAITQCQPPTNRCCLSSASAPNNQTCVMQNTVVVDGGACGNNCSCISNCCVGGTCYAFKTLSTGSPCGNSCQCQNTCSGGFCT